MKTRAIPKVILDQNPSQASKDFTLNLTNDIIALMRRSMDIMVMEIGAPESINILLSVLALAGVSTASGGGAVNGTFARYAKLAEEAIERKNDEGRTLP
jgi:hypothetical protein